MACRRCSAAVLIGGNLPWVHQSVISRAWVEGTQSSAPSCSPVAGGQQPREAWGLPRSVPARTWIWLMMQVRGSLRLAWGKQELLPKMLALAVAENPLPSPVCIIRDLSTHEEAGGKGRGLGFGAGKLTRKLNNWVVFGKLLDPWKFFTIWIRERAKHMLQGCCENQVSYHIQSTLSHRVTFSSSQPLWELNTLR